MHEHVIDTRQNGCRAYHHDRLAERSSKLHLNSNFLNAEARHSSFSVRNRFPASTLCPSRTRRARLLQYGLELNGGTRFDPVHPHERARGV
eukprot:4187453-Prymnesium_polylepis.1